MPKTRAMAGGQKKTTRSMSAKGNASLSNKTKEPSLLKHKVTGKAKTSVKKAALKPPMFPNLPGPTQSSLLETIASKTTSPSERPEAHNHSSLKAGGDVHHEATNTGYEADRDGDAASDTESIQSWEKDIMRWKPGQRPPLKHHPYDVWKNRPTAKLGKGGEKISIPHRSSDEEPDHGEANDLAKDTSIPRIRGGGFEEVHDHDFEGVMLGPGFEDTDMFASDLSSADSQDRKALPYTPTVRLLNREWNHVCCLMPSGPTCSSRFPVFPYIICSLCLPLFISIAKQ